MRILVTGGAGYIGTELVKKLARQDHVTQVVIYDNLSRGNYNSFIGPRITGERKLKFVQGDILDSRTLHRVLGEVDLVYHLAAKVTTPFGTNDPNVYEQVNHWGTAELVYEIERLNSVRLIHLSTTSVYGSSESVVDESSPIRPSSFYAISKARGEGHVQRLVDQGCATIIRCGNVYGYSPSMRFDAVINKFAFEANFLNRITIHGDGHQSRAFIHVDHLVTILGRLANATVPAGIYNVVSNNFRILDIVEVLQKLQPSLEFIFVDQHLKLRNLVVDPEMRLTSVLDTTGGKTFTDELEDFFAGFAYNPLKACNGEPEKGEN